MSEFDELKVEAKTLGVKIHGLKTPELKLAVEQARLAQASNPASALPGSDVDLLGADQTLPIATAPSAPAQVDAPKMPEIKKNFNSVVIYNGKQEIRTYSLAIHGEKFADIATGFANERGYRMELIDTGKNITCPKCGHSFAPRS